MRFDRSSSFAEGASLSRRRHLQEQYELNNFYWTSSLAADVTSYQSKKNGATTPAELLQALTFNSDSEDRLSDSTFTLQERLSHAGRWRRLTTLLIAVSAFERFIVGAADAALSSDPALSHDWPKHVDGLMLKKYDVKLSRPSTDEIVRGEWPKRIAAFKAIFGNDNTIMDASVSELDQIRNARNAIAHEFGYGKSHHESGFVAALVTLRPRRGLAPEISISHERLKKWLKLLNDVSKELDKMLLTRYIGGYEIPAIYLDWSINPDRFEAALGVNLDHSKKVDRLRFRHAIADFFPPIGDEYFMSMKAYVESL